MTIDALVQMAESIHDAEHWDLGAGSSRDTRNAFWARVIGCAHHGHPRYNLVPDPQWHLKNAGAGRPQSDDVAVSMPSRQYWDCIGGAGAQGYKFIASGYPNPLPADQEVYPPPVPQGTSPGAPPVPPPNPPPVDTTALLAKLEEVLTLIDTVVDEQAAQRAILTETADQANQARAWAHDCRRALTNGLALDGEGVNRYLGATRFSGVVKG